MEIIVSWKKNIPMTTREKIKKRFRISGITVNKESRLTLRLEDMEDFRAVVERGWLKPVNKTLLHPNEKRNGGKQSPKE